MPQQSDYAGGGVDSDRTAVFAAPILRATGLAPSTTALMETPPRQPSESGTRARRARTAMAAATIALACCLASTGPSTAAGSKAKVLVSYVPPTDPAHQP